MRRLALMSLLIIGLVFSSAGAHAALFNIPGDALALDSNTGQNWIRNLSAFSSGTYDEQQFAINVLNQVSYSGLTDWHMATLSDMQGLWTYDADVLAAHFGITYVYSTTTLSGDIMRYGRYNSMQSGSSPTAHYYAGIYYDASQGTNSLKTLESWAVDDSLALVPWGAWVVSAAPVPVPSSLLLLLSGLIAGAGLLKRFKR